jgi:hypothetical protein
MDRGGVGGLSLGKKEGGNVGSLESCDTSHSIWTSSLSHPSPRESCLLGKQQDSQRYRREIPLLIQSLTIAGTAASFRTFWAGERLSSLQKPLRNLPMVRKFQQRGTWPSATGRSRGIIGESAANPSSTGSESITVRTRTRTLLLLAPPTDVSTTSSTASAKRSRRSSSSWLLTSIGSMVGQQATMSDQIFFAPLFCLQYYSCRIVSRTRLTRLGRACSA